MHLIFIMSPFVNDCKYIGLEKQRNCWDLMKQRRVDLCGYGILGVSVRVSKVGLLLVVGSGVLGWGGD